MQAGQEKRSFRSVFELYYWLLFKIAVYPQFIPDKSMKVI